MGAFLENYGVGDERRSKIIQRVVLAVLSTAIIALLGYIFSHNRAETGRVHSFLDEVNGRQFDQAYRDWGCGPEHPCRDYSYQRFLQDWGPQKNVTPPWKVQSVDGCTSFVTVNVIATGAELQSLMVTRDTKMLGFAPSPECQEKKWRWGQFFHRLLGKSDSDAPPRK